MHAEGGAEKAVSGRMRSVLPRMGCQVIGGFPIGCAMVWDAASTSGAMLKDGASTSGAISRNGASNGGAISRDGASNGGPML